jgi:hypothetical protein
MSSKSSHPYDQFPKISRDFSNEAIARVRSACGAIDILWDYQGKRPRSEIEYNQFRSICYIMARFAILELCTLLDGSGELSLVLHRDKRGKYSVQRARLRRLYPSLSADQLNHLQRKLDELLAQNTSLVKRLLHSRHNRIAHARQSSYTFDPMVLTSIRFPKQRCYQFAGKLQQIVFETSDFENSITSGLAVAFSPIL